MKKFALALAAAALSATASHANPIEFHRVQHGSDEFRQLYAMGPVYRFAEDDQACAKLSSIPTFHANFADSEFSTTSGRSALVIVSQTDRGPLVYAYSREASECETLRTAYHESQEARAAAAPATYEGGMLHDAGGNRIHLNSIRCSWGDGTGGNAWVHGISGTLANAYGCWVQRGDKIEVTWRVMTGPNSLTPANSVTVLDIPRT